MWAKGHICKHRKRHLLSSFFQTPGSGFCCGRGECSGGRTRGYGGYCRWGGGTLGAAAAAVGVVLMWKLGVVKRCSGKFGPW
ncbi:hypothetical protein DPMN_089066 [Dreissena polymorpha]|uniref:Uncharacterized protein n=1 Tax=Dreissena polymorpha TaxID=45954 RepID=A0A9D4KXH0_DREPO|nr:hypothetical protein DPMN_089066 [Dreissena polymorpha]